MRYSTWIKAGRHCRVRYIFNVVARTALTFRRRESTRRRRHGRTLRRLRLCILSRADLYRPVWHAWPPGWLLDFRHAILQRPAREGFSDAVLIECFWV